MLSAFILVLVALAYLFSFVQAACIPTAHNQAASRTATLPSTALITARPDLKRRDANSICGLWSTSMTAFETYTISCDSGVPCVFQNYQPGTVIGYCSSKDAQVKTTAYNSGLGPASGCSPGQLCCDSANPEWGVYVFAESSSLTICGSTRFWRTATATIEAVEASSPPSPTPTSTSDSTGKWPTATILGVVFGALGGTGAFIGGVIAIIRHCKNPNVDDNEGTPGNTSKLMNLTHSGPTTSRPELHFHGTVNLQLRDSPVHVYGGGGGMGSNMNLVTSSRNASRMMITDGR